MTISEEICLSVRDAQQHTPTPHTHRPHSCPAAPSPVLTAGVSDSSLSQLLPVPMELMGCDYLAYHQSLTTAFRLLEGYGVLRLGDCVIQNAPESAVGALPRNPKSTHRPGCFV